MKFTILLVTLLVFVSNVMAIECWIGAVVGTSGAGLFKSETVQGSTTGATACSTYRFQCTAANAADSYCKNIPAGTTLNIYAPVPSCSAIPAADQVVCCATNYCNAPKPSGAAKLAGMTLALLAALLI